MKRRFIYCIVLLTGLVCAACGKKDEVLRTDRTRDSCPGIADQAG